jgi:O-antigen chain-terminating methyltransferase
MVQTLGGRVRALPEIYQPIFGHPELSASVSRGCDDRLDRIVDIYRAVEAHLGRPPHVLDLGCAQGFFSCSLARLGATVHGVDFLAANIAVCDAIAGENPDLALSFAVGRIEDTIAATMTDQYDLVLGLSVFHHIVQAIGVARVQAMLADLATKVTAGIFELALASEPLAWARAQPRQPRHLLRGFAFVHQVAQCATHLSAVGRPLYVASNRVWFLNGQIAAFDRWQDDSHPFAHGTHEGSRRYFFGAGVIAKLFHLDAPPRAGGPIARLLHRQAPTRRAVNEAEWQNEMTFLRAPPPGYVAPRLVLQGRNDETAWLVREQLSGELLIDIMRRGGNINPRAILRDVLAQLVLLESAGLYHNDVRPWNILIGPGGTADLIDYGSIGPRPRDCVWPHDLFLAFIVFVQEVARGSVARHANLPLLSISPYRAIATIPYRLAPPFRQFLTELWSHPRSEWSFALLGRLFAEIDNSSDGADWVQAPAAWRWRHAATAAGHAWSIIRGASTAPGA